MSNKKAQNDDIDCSEVKFSKRLAEQRNICKIDSQMKSTETLEKILENGNAMLKQNDEVIQLLKRILDVEKTRYVEDRKLRTEQCETRHLITHFGNNFMVPNADVIQAAALQMQNMCNNAPEYKPPRPICKIKDAYEYNEIDTDTKKLPIIEKSIVESASQVVKIYEHVTVEQKSEDSHVSTPYEESEENRDNECVDDSKKIDWHFKNNHCVICNEPKVKAARHAQTFHKMTFTESYILRLMVPYCDVDELVRRSNTHNVAKVNKKLTNKEVKAAYRSLQNRYSKVFKAFPIKSCPPLDRYNAFKDFQTSTPYGSKRRYIKRKRSLPIPEEISSIIADDPVINEVIQVSNTQSQLVPTYENCSQNNIDIDL